MFLISTPGMYYLRTKPAAQAIQFTVDKTKLKEAAANGSEAKDEKNGGGSGDGVETINKNMAAMVCSIQNKDDCLMCGS